MSTHSEQIIGLYRRHARTWAEKRASQPGRLMEATWLDGFLGLLPSDPTVLDIGCGSGEPMAHYLASHGCGVTGIDSAPEMVAICKDNFPEQTWQVGDMRKLSLGRTFNAILAWDSFFHLPPADQRQMFSVFRAHAAPGAALMFTSGPRYGEAIGTFEGEPLYHASLDCTEYRTLLYESGFGVVEHAVEDPACGRHTIWLAQRGVA
jgi:SAM-dependent methyltransferase